MQRFIKILTSLRLTVVCLSLGIILVFFGTLAQVNEGLYLAQERWFRSFFIWWSPKGASWGLPVFPGGYLVGTVLLVNLIAAHLKRFKLTWSKLGIHLTHLGIILLLLGQLATDIFSEESHLRLNPGESRNYSESHMDNELALILPNPETGRDRVVSIPESMLVPGNEITHDQLPFTIRVKDHYINASLRNRAPMVDKGPPPATVGLGPRITLEPMPEVRTTDERNMPAVIVELVGPGGPLGSWLLSTWLTDSQPVSVAGKTWELALRWKRFYTPFSIQLLKATHEVYLGTETPKNFQSRVRIENPRSGENREVDIYMNNPLRYEGLTYYQYQMGEVEVDERIRPSTLQVVRNPTWLTPYLACLLVGAGLLVQFSFHLIQFISKRRSA